MVIRGAAVATFTVDGEDVVVEGSSATTWVERSLQAVERMQIELEAVGADDESAPSYVVDGGLFRVSRIEETRSGDLSRPVRTLHVVESPETGGVIPFAAVAAVAEEQADEPDLDDGGRGRRPGGRRRGGADLGGRRRQEPEPPVRSPEPPAWTPAPPDDHDGLTMSGPPLPPPPPPGIPGQQPAPDVTKVVARLVISSGQTVDVDRVTVIGRAPESKQHADERAAAAGHRAQRRTCEISSTHIEVRPGTGADHGTAVITDLGSTNGTVVVQPGLGPAGPRAGRAGAAAARRAHRHRRRHHDPGHPPLTSDAMTATAPSQSPADRVHAPVLDPVPAGLDRRFYAFVLDRLLLWSLYAAAAAGAYAWFLRDEQWLPGVAVIAGAVLLLTLVYSAVARRAGGSRPGKAALGLRVARADEGGPIGFPRALLRSVILGLATRADVRVRRRRARLDGRGRPRRSPPRLARPAGPVVRRRRPSATGARGRGRSTSPARSST